MARGGAEGWGSPALLTAKLRHVRKPSLSQSILWGFSHSLLPAALRVVPDFSFERRPAFPACPPCPSLGPSMHPAPSTLWAE